MQERFIWLKKNNLRYLLIELVFKTTLEASMNQISKVGNLHKHWAYSLETISMSENKLTELPETMSYLVDLKTLNLQNNSIERLPAPALCRIHSLEELNLTGNQLTSDPFQ